MSNIDQLSDRIATLDGFVASALVDHGSGMMLSSRTGGTFDIELAAAANTEVVRSKLRAIDLLGGDEVIEDILITLGSQYHLIYLPTRESLRGLFVYLVLDRSRANLALARRTLAQAAEIAEL